MLGQTIRLEGESFLIVGVAPESFPGREPSRNFMEPSRSGIDDAPDAWSPLLHRSHQLIWNRSAYDFRFFGRLKPGISCQQAENELKVLDAQQAELAGQKLKTAADHRRVRLVPGFARIPPLQHKDEFRGVGSEIGRAHV